MLDIWYKKRNKMERYRKNQEVVKVFHVEELRIERLATLHTSPVKDSEND